MPGTSLTERHDGQMAEELDNMIRLLDAQRFQEARHRVNRRLVETLDRTRGRFVGLLHPVRIDFDNRQSPTDTMIEIRSTDTPAFLYAFANALAMRGVYIRKARFQQIGVELTIASSFAGGMVIKSKTLPISKNFDSLPPSSNSSPNF